jgi:hypothetical protein
MQEVADKLAIKVGVANRFCCEYHRKFGPLWKQQRISTAKASY